MNKKQLMRFCLKELNKILKQYIDLDTDHYAILSDFENVLNKKLETSIQEHKQNLTIFDIIKKYTKDKDN